MEHPHEIWHIPPRTPCILASILVVLTLGFYIG